MRELQLLAITMAEMRRSLPEPVSDEQMVRAAIRGMLRELDPEASLFVDEELAELRGKKTEADMKAEAGIGLTLTLRGDRVTVLSVADGSPAHLACVPQTCCSRWTASPRSARRCSRRPPCCAGRPGRR